MRLISSNGNVVALTIGGYEYPAHRGSGDDPDWDANWLIIQGQVVNGEDQWSFRDPCLLTWEARKLAGWLRSVADGSRRPEPVDPDGEGSGLLVFLEPNLAFNLHDRTPESATVRVYLSLEALPHVTEPEIFEHFVELTMTNEEIAAAVADWEAELGKFPVRA